ncbi:hypothetical protein F9L33_05750 [Amylibacter sp. SFDW26]|uniref:hypothetical protein n=1 Tax=Amylibacter sp. SFDW26 TaxID=2652722 RepID=UPI0012629BFC|nr:hypothetical protein [Amylibacter sp. SFDW26]KAB7616253.1 hypothetical protein F9L33_05750 [Amylibacter sp. SFDW26]
MPKTNSFLLKTTTFCAIVIGSLSSAHATELEVTDPCYHWVAKAAPLTSGYMAFKDSEDDPIGFIKNYIQFEDYPDGSAGHQIYSDMLKTIEETESEQLTEEATLKSCQALPVEAVHSTNMNSPISDFQ